MKKDTRPIYTLDLETDPFLYDRVPKPFAAGFYDGHKFVHTWGKSCIPQMARVLKEYPPGIIYAHNGGKFDFHYLLDWADGECKIINNRIVTMPTNTGHEMRDSYAILPTPLAKFGTDAKDEIDYAKLEKPVREKHKPEIIRYLKKDCVSLWHYVASFIEEFGVKLTIGGTAMGQLRKFHQFESLEKITDFLLRDFYFGGRVQCFEKGVFSGDFKMYDTISMYPSAMKNFLHPLDLPSSDGVRVTKNTAFLVVEGENLGAFCKRDKNGSLRFDINKGVFFVTIHEWEQALALGLFKPERVHKTVNFNNQGSFADFVDHFFSRRKRAQDNHDDARTLFYKLVLNSAYGKFAQNPLDFKDYQIISVNRIIPIGWNVEMIWDGKWYLISQPSSARVYYNVATAASITGAARSLMMKAIHTAKRPLYCDTDSLICENLPGVRETKELGTWKYEGSGNRLAIAGKKMYALFDDKTCVKSASKGVKISPEEIEEIANGGEVYWQNIAPAFSIKRATKFIARTVRMT